MTSMVDGGVDIDVKAPVSLIADLRVGDERSPFAIMVAVMKQVKRKNGESINLEGLQMPPNDYGTDNFLGIDGHGNDFNQIGLPDYILPDNTSDFNHFVNTAHAVLLLYFLLEQMNKL